MPNKSNLDRAKKAKFDEFYTMYEDVENEVKHYTEQLKGKVVYCNCDDPLTSNFWKYFHFNYEKIGLKGLYASHYLPYPIVPPDTTLLPIREDAGYMYYKGGHDAAEWAGEYKRFKSVESSNYGDYKSEECKAIFEKADVIVTNPPFSLFREYFNFLVDSGKKFIITANINALTDIDVFKALYKKKARVGYTWKALKYKTLAEYEGSKKEIGKEYYTNIFTTILTNIEINDKPFYYSGKKYKDGNYKKYDNCDAIEISKLSELPDDYNGIMGVPVTIFKVLNNNQFEIVGSKCKGYFTPTRHYNYMTYQNKNTKYNTTKVNTTFMIEVTEEEAKKAGAYYTYKGNYYFQTYFRILIKRKTE